MNHYFSVKALCLAAFVSHFSCAAECSPVSIEIAPAHEFIASKYRVLIEDERKKGVALYPIKIIRWKFQEKSGEFLLANMARKRSKSCLLFLVRANEFVSLGGNDDCTWKGDPRLVWREHKAWLEFPFDIKRRSEFPVAANELTAHFNKETGDVCILGLPLEGYNSVRCPDDEAPDSN